MMGNIAPYNAPTLTLALKGEGNHRQGHNTFTVSPWFLLLPPQGGAKPVPIISIRRKTAAYGEGF
jgi:hypothetical protein